MEYKVNNGRKDCIIGEKGIKHFEKKYNAQYVADLCLRGKNGGWINEPAAIFYQEKPINPQYGNYFAIIVKDKNTYITAADSSVAEPILGIVADNGEVIFSSYRHHFKTSEDGSVYIDGGRDYTKNNNPVRIVNIKISKGTFVVSPFNYKEELDSEAIISEASPQKLNKK